MRTLIILLFSLTVNAQITLTVSGTTYNIIADQQFNVGTSIAYAEGVQFCASLGTGAVLPIVYPDMRYVNTAATGTYFNVRTGVEIDGLYVWENRDNMQFYSSSITEFIPLNGEYIGANVPHIIQYLYTYNNGVAVSTTFTNYPAYPSGSIVWKFLDPFYSTTPTVENGNYALTIDPSDIDEPEVTSGLSFEIDDMLYIGDLAEPNIVYGLFRIVRHIEGIIWEVSPIYYVGEVNYQNMQFLRKRGADTIIN